MSEAEQEESLVAATIRLLNAATHQEELLQAALRLMNAAAAAIEAYTAKHLRLSATVYPPSVKPPTRSKGTSV